MQLLTKTITTFQQNNVKFITSFYSEKKETNSEK